MWIGVWARLSIQIDSPHSCFYISGHSSSRQACDRVSFFNCGSSLQCLNIAVDIFPIALFYILFTNSILREASRNGGKAIVYVYILISTFQIQILYRCFWLTVYVHSIWKSTHYHVFPLCHLKWNESSIRTHLIFTT